MVSDHRFSSVLILQTGKSSVVFKKGSDVISIFFRRISLTAAQRKYLGWGVMRWSPRSVSKIETVHDKPTRAVGVRQRGEPRFEKSP